MDQFKLDPAGVSKTALQGDPDELDNFVFHRFAGKHPSMEA
jgi:hypothetical protein